MNKTHTILVYCRSGRRSRYASSQLAELGYVDLRNMKRGFKEWSTRDTPLSEKPETGPMKIIPVYRRLGFV